MSAVPNRAPKSGFAAEAQRKVGSVFHVSQGICFIIINVISSPKKHPKVQISIKKNSVETPRLRTNAQTMHNCDRNDYFLSINKIYRHIFLLITSFAPIESMLLNALPSCHYKPVISSFVGLLKGNNDKNHFLENTRVN